MVSILNIGTQYFDGTSRIRNNKWDRRFPKISYALRSRFNSADPNVPKKKIIGLMEMNLKTLADLEPVIRKNGYSYIYQTYLKVHDEPPTRGSTPLKEQILPKKFKDILKSRSTKFSGYDVFRYKPSLQSELNFYSEILFLIYNPKFFSVEETESIYFEKGSYIDEFGNTVYQRISRSALRVVFLDKGLDTKIAFYLTHLDHQSQESRIKNTKQIADLVKKDLDAGYKVIASGDWNCFDDEGDMYLKQFKDLDKVAKDLTAEVVPGFKTCETPTTIAYPGEPPKGKNVCIDRIFSGPSIDPDWGRIQFLDGGSDHGLVEVSVSF